MSEKMVEQGGGDRPVWLEFAGVELRVTMPDESVWAVPAHIIADSYANYYTAADGDEYDDLYRFVMEQTDVLTDWASGDMNWSDVKAQARMVDGPDPVDYEEGWANGYQEVVRITATPGDPQ
jgi:hypothetical protein